MSDLPMVVSDNNGFGGANMGAGFIGGLVLGSLWNGNGFGVHILKDLVCLI